MSNTIALAEKFQPILDEIYKKASLTSMMDARTKPVDFAGASVVNVFKTSMVGLGTYSRSSGYPAGDVTGAWESLELTAQRGREFNIDRMDDEETLGMAFGTLAGEFIRTQVAPEVDAYRFATYAGWSSISGTTGTLSAGTILAAIDAGSLQMDTDEVPDEGRILFISSACHSYLESAVTRTLSNENAVDRRVAMFDGMQVVKVPQGRFYTAISLDAGGSSDAGGYSDDGEDINFMLVHPTAVLQATKLANLKIFSPDENQDMDAWKIQYRLYHDAFVYDNKVDGIYMHAKAS